MTFLEYVITLSGIGRVSIVVSLYYLCFSTSQFILKKNFQSLKTFDKKYCLNLKDIVDPGHNCDLFVNV